MSDILTPGDLQRILYPLLLEQFQGEALTSTLKVKIAQRIQCIFKDLEAVGFHLSSDPDIPLSRLRTQISFDEETQDVMVTLCPPIKADHIPVTLCAPPKADNCILINPKLLSDWGADT